MHKVILFLYNIHAYSHLSLYYPNYSAHSIFLRLNHIFSRIPTRIIRKLILWKLSVFLFYWIFDYYLLNVHLFDYYWYIISSVLFLVMIDRWQYFLRDIRLYMLVICYLMKQLSTSFSFLNDNLDLSFRESYRVFHFYKNL